MIEWVKKNQLLAGALGIVLLSGVSATSRTGRRRIRRGFAYAKQRAYRYGRGRRGRRGYWRGYRGYL